MMNYDAIIVGAGISGVYQLYRLKQMGLKVVVLEAGSDAGGTWYWNQYPGCRFDSESYSYCYSFSEDLLQEWNWSEHFAGQPEIHRYLTHVVDKFDLLSDMLFDATLTTADYDNPANHCRVNTADSGTLP